MNAGCSPVIGIVRHTGTFIFLAAEDSKNVSHGPVQNISRERKKKYTKMAENLLNIRNVSNHNVNKVQ